jgi:hypothetical protein
MNEKDSYAQDAVFLYTSLVACDDEFTRLAMAASIIRNQPHHAAIILAGVAAYVAGETNNQDKSKSCKRGKTHD